MTEQVRNEHMTEGRVIDLAIPRRRLYQNHGDGPLLETLMKATPASMNIPGQGSPSQQGIAIGHKQHPFDFEKVALFQLENAHHSTCLKTKCAATTGLGFENDKTEETLDPLTRGGWQSTINKVTEDYVQSGNGYLECVHGDPGDPARITGMHHIPAKEMIVVVDDPVNYHLHYELISREATRLTRFAEFGDLAAFNARLSLGQVIGAAQGDTLSPNTSAFIQPSEVIHFKRESALSRWYGFPDWLAAVASCELVQALHQHNYDFFINRGVPEFLLFLLGKKVAPEDWEKIEKTLKASVGLGNAFKSGAFNIQDPEMTVQLEKLAMDGKSDVTMFAQLAEALSIEIVSAHRVPPLLAGILVPGRLGSANELPNALLSFQILVVGPQQKSFESMLNYTLGNPLLNGGLSLKRGDFAFKKITDVMNLQMMQTMGGMKQTVVEAQAEGRDLSQGFKKEGSEAAEALLGHLMTIALEHRMARDAAA